MADTVPVEILVFVAGLAVVGLFVWWRYERAQRRRTGMFSFAADHLFQYSREDPFGLTHVPFWLFTRGESRGCQNVVWGEWEGTPLKVADYWYYDESKDSEGHTSRSYRRFSVAVAELDWVVPQVSVRPEGIASRLADHLGFRDLAFESEGFNRSFQVEAGDREFAYKLLDARMITWLEPLDGFGFETLGRFLLVWSERLAPEELPALLAAVRGFREHVPRVVKSMYGTGPAADREERSAP